MIRCRRSYSITRAVQIFRLQIKLHTILPQLRLQRNQELLFQRLDFEHDVQTVDAANERHRIGKLHELFITEIFLKNRLSPFQCGERRPQTPFVGVRLTQINQPA